MFLLKKAKLSRYLLNLHMPQTHGTMKLMIPATTLIAQDSQVVSDTSLKSSGRALKDSVVAFLDHSWYANTIHLVTTSANLKTMYRV